MYIEPTPTTEFSAIRLKLASPEAIHRWSFGEVTKPETVNYRTQKPEKEGLFSERIFGPSKDWECYCGKYKKIRYKGIVCDKCGVEVTRAVVRRERMGHIDLKAPVSHIWFLRGVPSKIGLLLDISMQNLEKVIYFANFIITEVNEELKAATIEQVKQEYQSKRKSIESDYQREVQEVQSGVDGGTKRGAVVKVRDERLLELEEVFALAERELKELKPMKIISESTYHDLSLKYGHVFTAAIGAEAIYELLERIDLSVLLDELKTELAGASGAKVEKITRRLKLTKSFIQNHLRPEWMILTALPIIPPDLRPMVPLDGGRFATSDLNDLYRRIINRNNRLKQLLDLNAPEVITRNEKRMLQEAVDALIDNSARHGKTVMAATGQKRSLKSLADMLKGKQGRFRQNLLGKRIDYSGRSVIVVGPTLKMHQCGLPKRMALELFRPFVISQLISREYVHNVRSAHRYIETGRAEVWDILAEIVADAHVLLNRAPTLHRLGIQAFRPVLVEGKAIQLHPLVCPAFNADFDGDQMAVHVPLTKEARREAEELMLASKNLLKPAHGEPVASPNQDIVWGIYYLTSLDSATTPEAEQRKRTFSSSTEAITTYDLKAISMREPITVRLKDGSIIETSVGRLLFNEVLPESAGYLNEHMDKKKLNQLVKQVLEVDGVTRTAEFLDALKELGFYHLTVSGLSWSMGDIPALPQKEAIIEETQRQVDEVDAQYEEGLLTNDERHSQVVQLWTSAKDQVVAASKNLFPLNSPVYTMVESGARGSWGQLTQIVGMKGLVTNPAGDIIELPVKGNFRDGFDVLEYFISTHGARKGLSDTALRTANAGYLTRRLVDVAQDVIVQAEDCGDIEGLVITREDAEAAAQTLEEKVAGRTCLERVTKPGSRKVLIKEGQIISSADALVLKAEKVPAVRIATALTCKVIRGVCAKCYGLDLGYNRPVDMGTAVGIIAAESIGEPGTQLTMRTFHSGGVAGEDITQGLPRVEELFEVRPPKRKAFLADVAGVVSITQAPREEGSSTPRGQRLLKIVSDAPVEGADEEEGANIREFTIPQGYSILVKDKDTVAVGDQLTDGSLDLQQLFRLRGRLETQRYIMREIQYIYSSQGQKLNDKHVEVIARQLFSRVYVTDAGQSDLLPGEIVEKAQAEEANLSNPPSPVIYEELLLGMTKSALSTKSFLAAASFQETARVLINAATSGRVDRLEGLKENVLIGRLIPAGTGFRRRGEETKKKPLN
ncbi:DNA-directed RNA polymerase subunit beta' [Candidatus Uhrbacteria bacterium CG10_big_fil_rev_8_21_14_0_10_48_11]|uniref:DNA-directed RNA polymerase subunit beta' n=1 Tax=Candidatus Uhrbacteria bacterium CG10_big_fil_rev_8_21_14_0_10_48_11 TaxID=1975037 RepID=A0A2M8LFI8_9BACT|nr:MAG: DNA-directed RNA polymerase subunit beta' [Candidatus Uhrbacteria bacterium CG10_big_fil_rev_8_21_14_0_10_48_11]